MRLSKRSSNIPTKSDLMKLRTEIAHAAQKIYDEWSPEDGIDEELGAGGICDQIANEIIGVLSNHDYDAEEGGHDGDDHAYAVIRTDESHGFSIDIPYNIYEHKLGMYEYQKIPNVKFDENDVYIDEF